MRKQLIEWLKNIVEQLDLSPKFLQSVIMLTDIVLFSEKLNSNEYQKLGITCFRLMSKVFLKDTRRRRESFNFRSPSSMRESKQHRRYHSI